MAYEYKESYKHKLAKELLFKWLDDENKKANINNDSCKFAQFNWRKNYGVFMELIVQEKDDAFYFEQELLNSEKNPLMYCCPGDMEKSTRTETNYNKIVKELGKILFVPDIVIFHKGSPKYVFEITHTHELTKEKVDLIKSIFGVFSVHEFQADDILKLDCMKIPEKIKCLEW